MKNEETSIRDYMRRGLDGLGALRKDVLAGRDSAELAEKLDEINQNFYWVYNQLELDVVEEEEVKPDVSPSFKAVEEIYIDCPLGGCAELSSCHNCFRREETTEDMWCGYNDYIEQIILEMQYKKAE